MAITSQAADGHLARGCTFDVCSTPAEPLECSGCSRTRLLTVPQQPVVCAHPKEEWLPGGLVMAMLTHPPRDPVVEETPDQPAYAAGIRELCEQSYMSRIKVC